MTLDRLLWHRGKSLLRSLQHIKDRELTRIDDNINRHLNKTNEWNLAKPNAYGPDLDTLDMRINWNRWIGEEAGYCILFVKCLLAVEWGVRVLQRLHVSGDENCYRSRWSVERWLISWILTILQLTRQLAIIHSQCFTFRT